MPTIAEHLGVRLPDTDYVQSTEIPNVGGVGIEVELENVGGGRWPRDIDGWVAKDDGSLRDGKEYIFNGPQAGSQAVQTIHNLATCFETVGVEPTFRCSTHIHLDVRDLEWDKLERLVLLYIVYEDMMFDHCQPYRRQSNFCIPFQSNDWLTATFGTKVMGSGRPAYKFQQVSMWPKYSGLNLRSIGSFGSVEFRGMHATVDAEELIGLTQRMLHLKRYVLEDESENHTAFLGRLTANPIKEVFPTGIKEGYAMEDGAFEQGLSSAYHALILSKVNPARPLEMENQRRRAPGWAVNEAIQDRPTVVEDIIRRAIDHELSRVYLWDREAMADNNIHITSTSVTLGEAIKVAATLNIANNNLNLRLTDLTRGVSRESLLYLSRNYTVVARTIGMRIFPELLS